MSALVSILIPAYNAETTIADTLDSAVSQTWPDKEIIVVDDGSTDRTVAVARRYAARNVTVVSRENQGAAASRNAAFSLCNGDYIQWLDADDLLSSNKIESQMLARTSGCTPRTLLSAAWGYFMHRPHRATFTPTSLWCDLTPTEWLFRKMGQNLHMQTATWLVSRALTEAAGPWNTQLLGDDDGEYFCRVLMASDGVRFVPEARVFYRRSGSSRLSYIGHSDRKIYAHFHSMKLHIDYLLSLEDSARTRDACVKYLQTWFIHFYPEKTDIVHEAEQLAASLGGRLTPPVLSWKFDWVRSLFGWTSAKRTQERLRRLKWSAFRRVDLALSRLGGPVRGT
jgi:glycosyltransferase involved in cell wall biosynthesis